MQGLGDSEERGGRASLGATASQPRLQATWKDPSATLTSPGLVPALSALARPVLIRNHTQDQGYQLRSGHLTKERKYSGKRVTGEGWIHT